MCEADHLLKNRKENGSLEGEILDGEVHLTL